MLATGVKLRVPDIDGIDRPNMLNYLDVLREDTPVGTNVAVVGAGGIGFDIAEYLTQTGESASVTPARFYAEWGIDTSYRARGGVRMPDVDAPARRVYLLQRKASRVGEQLGKTTGWIHRTSLRARGVAMSSSVAYERIDDAGCSVQIDGDSQTLPVDQVVICAGQEPRRELLDGLRAAGFGGPVHLIGAADVATELDAKRAIHQGTTLAATI